VATGGTSATGGVTGLGGTKATGGAISAGGTSGTTNAGGAVSSGGTTSLGGAASIAGTTSHGGTTSGGTATTGGATDAAGSPGVPFVPTSNSCQKLTTLCQGESCCTSIMVPGGTFKMGRGSETCSNCTDGCPGGQTCNANETPEHDATVAPFALDKYEVTVGRFRKYVEAYDSLGAPPADGGGVNPNVLGTGWQKAWNGNLSADSTALKNSQLKCNSSYQTWTDTAVENEAYPINCLNWYHAFAFCIWDGGRLPTEAEWEYAATGGNQNRIYPWGNSPPDSSRANYNGSNYSPYVAAGSKGTTGAGYFGHADLAGSMWEWAFDWFSSSYYGSTASPTVCSNCANTTGASYRAIRSGGWGNEWPYSLRSAFRVYGSPGDRGSGNGIRCARTPP
jgi:formylglycine-generating enzyme